MVVKGAEHPAVLSLRTHGQSCTHVQSQWKIGVAPLDVNRSSRADPEPDDPASCALLPGTRKERSPAKKHSQSQIAVTQSGAEVMPHGLGTEVLRVHSNMLVMSPHHHQPRSFLQYLQGSGSHVLIPHNQPILMLRIQVDIDITGNVTTQSTQLRSPQPFSRLKQNLYSPTGLRRACIELPNNQPPDCRRSLRQDPGIPLAR